MLLILTVFIHIIHAEHCIAQIRYSTMLQDLEYRDKISKIHPLKISQSWSVLACAMECTIEQPCGAMYFRGNDCVMFSSRTKAVYDVHNDTGWQFFHRNQSKSINLWNLITGLCNQSNCNCQCYHSYSKNV